MQFGDVEYQASNEFCSGQNGTVFAAKAIGLVKSTSCFLKVLAGDADRTNEYLFIFHILNLSVRFEV